MTSNPDINLVCMLLLVIIMLGIGHIFMLLDVSNNLHKLTNAILNSKDKENNNHEVRP